MCLMRQNTESKPCPCQLVDTECEFGYEYNSHAHECQKLPDVELNQCRVRRHSV
jgi:hypothetical protein